MTREESTMQVAAVTLCVLLLVHHPLPAWGQQVENQPLEIQAVKGDGVIHAIVRGNHKDPIVVVVRDGQPVNGARVMFRLPESGPSGSFGGLGTTWGATTGKNGRAVGK